MSHSTSEAHLEVMRRIVKLYEEAFDHDGHAELKIDIRFLRRGQKEVVLHSGKQYRFVLDFPRLGRQLSELLMTPVDAPAELAPPR